MGYKGYDEFDEYGTSDWSGSGKKAKRSGGSKSSGKKSKSKKSDHRHTYELVTFRVDVREGLPGDDNVRYEGTNEFECLECGISRKEFATLSGRAYDRLLEDGKIIER